MTRTERVARAIHDAQLNGQWRTGTEYRLCLATAALTAIDEERDALREALVDAAERGLEWTIEAANERKTKDAVFDNAYRDIKKIEAALHQARSLSSVDTLRARAATPSNKKGV